MMALTVTNGIDLLRNGNQQLRFRRSSEDFRPFSWKMLGNVLRLPNTFDPIPTNLRDKLDIGKIIDIFTSGDMNELNVRDKLNIAFWTKKCNGTL